MSKKKPLAALVRWLGEETLSVVPTTTVREADQIYIGSFVTVKWGGKYYESEILSISGLGHNVLKIISSIWVWPTDLVCIG